MISVQTHFAKGRERHVDVDLTAPFATGIIDPDWPYTVAPGIETLEAKNGKGKLSGFTRNRDREQNRYLRPEPMSLEELAAVRVGDLIGGYVLMWTVGPFLINGAAQRILASWGFEPASILTWAKYDLKKGHGYGGVGFWFLGNAEFCIVAKRKGWPSIRTGYSSLIVAPKTAHSVKPEHIHKLCEARFPGPFVEIFGRRQRDGWTVLGDEVPGGESDVVGTINDLCDGKKVRQSIQPQKTVLDPQGSLFE